MPEDQIQKTEQEIPKKCIIYYKTGFLRGKLFGERFDCLDSCCETFEEVFLHTGNDKNPSWEKNSLLPPLGKSEQGLNFVKENSQIVLLFCGKPISFCPWSGHALEIRRSRTLALKNKLKAVADGYYEVELPEGWDQ